MANAARGLPCCELLKRIQKDLEGQNGQRFEISSFDQKFQALSSCLATIAARRAQEDKNRERHRKQREQQAEPGPEAPAQEANPEELQEDLKPHQEIPEPPSMEPLCLVPQQPLPALDLSPLDLPAASDDEALSLLRPLLASRQLFAYTGAFEPASAAPLLRLLFNMVAYGPDPQPALQQALEYYAGSGPHQEPGWVPHLPDFCAALAALGYRPLPAGRKQAAAAAAAAATAAAGSAAAASGAAAGSQGDHEAPEGQAAAGGQGGGEQGGAAPRTANLQCLLRLLVGLVRLRGEGRLPMDFDRRVQAAGKSLFMALLRMLLDPLLSGPLYADVQSALEALAEPWDEQQWRGIAEETAAAAAELGPSHRSALRAVRCGGGAGALQPRLRRWQQAAALALLKRVLPQAMVRAAGAAGGSSGRRGGGGGAPTELDELPALLGREPGLSAATQFKKAMALPPQQQHQQGQRQRGAEGGGTGGGKDKEVTDWWRIFTAVQAAHLVVWNAAYPPRPQGDPEGEPGSRLAAWAAETFRCLDQVLRGRELVELHVRVFLAQSQAAYEAVS